MQGGICRRLSPDNGLVTGGVELIEFLNESRKLLGIARDSNHVAEFFESAPGFSSHNECLVAAAREWLLQRNHEGKANF